MRRLRIPQSRSVHRSTLFVLTATATLLLPAAGAAQAKRYPLESAGGLRFHNVTAVPAMLQGKKGLRVTIPEETLRRMERTQGYAQELSSGMKGVQCLLCIADSSDHNSCDWLEERLCPRRYRPSFARKTPCPSA